MERLLLSRDTEHACLFQATRTLKDGGVVVLPTDTVYGLAADIRIQQALEKVSIIKGRPKGKPFPVFISSYEQINDVAFVSEKWTEELLKKFWPGALTVLLSARGWLSMDLLSSPNNDLLNTRRGFQVGVRIPNNTFLLQMLHGYRYPVTATSANVSGRGPYTNPDDVVSEFDKLPFKPDLLIDAGVLADSLPSTVLDCTVWPPRIAREGAISIKDINDFIYQLV